MKIQIVTNNGEVIELIPGTKFKLHSPDDDHYVILIETPGNKMTEIICPESWKERYNDLGRHVGNYIGLVRGITALSNLEMVEKCSSGDFCIELV